MDRVLKSVFGPFKIPKHHVGLSHIGISCVVIGFDQKDLRINIDGPSKVLLTHQTIAPLVEVFDLAHFFRTDRGEIFLGRLFGAQAPDRPGAIEREER